MDRRSFLIDGVATTALLGSETVFRSHASVATATTPPAAANLAEVRAEAFSEPAYVTSGLLEWTIGNGLVDRVLKYSAESGLYTERWSHKVTGTNFVQPLPKEQPNTAWGAEFGFQVGSETFEGAVQGGSADFAFVSARTGNVSPAGKLLEIKLKAKRRPIEVSVYYAVYSGHPVVRKWIAVTNRGSERVTLSHFIFEAINLRPVLPSEKVLFAYYGVHPREIFFTGRAEDPAIMEMAPSSNEGFVVMNEAPGWMKRTEMNSWGDGVQVMYDTDLFPFERSLKPGETFVSAKSGIAFFVEGRGMVDPRWSMPLYTSQVLMRKGSSYQPPWLYNTWEPFFQDYNEEIVLKSIPVAAKMGLEVFTLDTGWSNDYDANKPNPEKFPHDFDSIRKELEGRGMRLGLWEPLAVVSAESQTYREHPEWVIRTLDGEEKAAAFPGKDDRVMCLASPYRDRAAERISKLIQKYHLKYVKIDLTTVFNAYGEAPGCYAKGHYHQNWAESLGGIYEGIQWVTQQIYRENPDVLLDLTFELWGQKHIIDYGLLDAGDLDWMSNVDDSSTDSAGPRQARTLLYHRCLAIPVETMLIGNLRATTPTIEERFGTVIGSGPLFLGDLRKLAPDEVRWYAEKIKWYKEFRASVPMQEGFFPLGNWLQPNAQAWDGFARLSRHGEGLIVLFKNETKLKQVGVQIPTYPAGAFRMRSVMTGDSLGSVSGQQFRTGFTVPLPDNSKVQIVEIRRR